ncbi:hypothetical protein TNCV_2080661 [Trichonephila clavipes]|nr:hypothetical protein TNCV_2080661 [Trichonephila clavipes]
MTDHPPSSRNLAEDLEFIAQKSVSAFTNQRHVQLRRDFSRTSIAVFPSRIRLACFNSLCDMILGAHSRIHYRARCWVPRSLDYPPIVYIWSMIANYCGQTNTSDELWQRLKATLTDIT